MKPKSLIVTLVIFLLIVFFGFVMQTLSRYSKPIIKFASEIQINNTVFATEISDTDAKKIKGLSNTEKLLPNQAMLFIFDRDEGWGIWMKDMNYSLDIIWLSSDKKIVDIKKNISPGTYPKVFYPEINARYVVEVLGGTVERENLAYGDEFFFKNTP